MTKKDALYMSELFQAVADGKQIQYRFGPGYMYLDCDLDPLVYIQYTNKLDQVIQESTFSHCVRIKPEPKYRDLSDIEFLELSRQRVEIIENDSEKRYNITGIGFDNDNNIFVIISSCNDYNDKHFIIPSKLRRLYSFTDGGVIGKIKEE